MKARLEVTLDTTWTNQVVASVECELDNPHSITSRMLSELMVQRLKFLAEEIRHASEREIPALIGDQPEQLESHRGRSGSPERERLAYEEMQDDRERDSSMLRERPVRDEQQS